MPKTRIELVADLEAAALAFAAVDAVYSAAWERHGEVGAAHKALHPETAAAMEACFAPQVALSDAIRALYEHEREAMSSAVPLALAAPGEAVQF
jgi:hypothetical protein